MSFESVYRSREGIREIEKIVGFCSSLVIKNEYEARIYENPDSLENFYQYEGAYLKTDFLSDYGNLLSDPTLSKFVKDRLTSDLYNYGTDIIDYLFNTPLSTLEQYSNSTYVISFLYELRYCRVFNYSEQNFYYRQFLGVPNTIEDIVYVRNYDSTDPNAKLPVHKIDENLYPETYTFFILRDNIATVIAENPDKVYIRFINTTNTPYYLRMLPNYSIISYDKKTLNNIEYTYFLEAFNRAKTQVTLDYINGFDSRFPAYNILMICNLLQFAIINYSNSYLERYSLGDYTEENVDDILDSNGYTNLKDISDLDLKKRIVKNLDELTAYKGTDYVLSMILEKILDSNNAEVNRIYIEKEYTVDKDYAITIDTSKSLENSIKLVFRETVYASQSELYSSNDIYHDYTEFVNQDDMWGGVAEDSYDTKISKQELIRKELLKEDFNSILTRYITLTRTVDILSVQREMADMLYIMLYRIIEGNIDIFFEQKFALVNFECTAAGLFGAMCWLQQMKYAAKTQTESADVVADTILKNQCLLNATTVFRKFGDMTSALQTGDYCIIDGEVVEDITPDFFKVYIKDVLENDDTIGVVQIKNIITYEDIRTNIDNPNENGVRMEKYEDFFVRYRYYDSEGDFLGEVTDSTTIGELISDYKAQSTPLLNKITQKLAKSSDYREFIAWRYLYSQNCKDNSFADLFTGYENYTAFMRAYESESLINYIYSNRIVDSDGDINLETVCTLFNIIKEAFENWVTENVSTAIFEEFGNVDNDTYIKDMTLLFKEFLSVYSELYKVNYQLEIEGDSVFKLALYYNPTYTYFSDNFRDVMELKHLTFTSFLDELNEDLSLTHILNSEYLINIQEAINKEIVYDENGYVITNPLTYEYDTIFKDKLVTNLELLSRLGIFISSDLEKENLSLSHKLELKN